MWARSTAATVVRAILQWALLALCLPAYSQITFNVSTGWNLLANSGATSVNVATAFGDATTVETVWKWNNATGKWAVYAPSMSTLALTDFAQKGGYDVLSSIASREGFWVKAVAAKALSFPATAATGLSATDLKTGWNLVGSADNKTPAQINQSLGTSLSAAGKSVLSAWSWDAPSTRWRFWAPSLEQQGATVLADYLSSNGYLSFSRPLAPTEGLWMNIASLPNSAKADVDITLGSDLVGKTIPPLLGVNAGPTPQGDATNVDVTTQYKAIGVTMVRTHDLYGPLDMSVMYPDRSKDPQLASSYDFSASDKAFDAIVAAGFEPYFRVGDSWNNVKPPTTAAERANWAAAAAVVVGHYLARGTFKYVEIWNEPDFATQFWPAPRNRLEFFDLYTRTAKAVKTAYPQLKVGGPALTQASFISTEGKEYLTALLTHIRANNAPLDFLSWHCYSSDPKDYSTGATYIRQQLDANGFTASENVISEYNTDDKNPDIGAVRLGGRGSAIISGAWISLVKSGVHQAFLYRGNDTSMNLTTFYGIFYADGSYKRNAYAFSLWSRMAGYPTQQDVVVSSSVLSDVSQIYALAGKSAAGEKAVLIANPTATAFTANLSGLNLPIKSRTVSDASTAMQEGLQQGSTVSVPAYSASLFTSDGR
jgi:xylan 1,4-beta-xylosidase